MKTEKKKRRVLYMEYYLFSVIQWIHISIRLNQVREYNFEREFSFDSWLYFNSDTSTYKTQNLRLIINLVRY